MTARPMSWWSSHGRDCLVFGLAVGLAGVWVLSHGVESRTESLRHLYAVNALAASMWGVVSRPVGERWTTIGSHALPDAPVAVGPSRFSRQTIWTTALWIATSALFLGGEGLVAVATTWVVLLCSLLVLGGLPLALEADLGVPRAQLVVLALATLIAAAVLGLSVIEPSPWPVRMWSRNPVKTGVAVWLLAVHGISGVVAARRRVGAGRAST